MGAVPRLATPKPDDSRTERGQADDERSAALRNRMARWLARGSSLDT
jgi:hypothetical protein